MVATPLAAMRSTHTLLNQKLRVLGAPNKTQHKSLITVTPALEFNPTGHVLDGKWPGHDYWANGGNRPRNSQEGGGPSAHHLLVEGRCPAISPPPVSSCSGRSPAKLGPKTPPDGSGSKDGVERTQTPPRRPIMKPPRDLILSEHQN